MPGAAAGAPTEDELRALPEELTGREERKLSTLSSSLSSAHPSLYMDEVEDLLGWSFCVMNWEIALPNRLW